MVNEEIREKEVRVVDVDGKQLGIMPLRQALELAQRKQLDLVNVAPQATPPVCRIMDYGKYKYEAIKQEKEAKKNQRIIDIKEIRLSTTIEEHDIDVKIKNAIKFLKNGDKVKVTVRFRGRQITHPDIAAEILKNFAEKVAEVGTIEKAPQMDGRNMLMILTPKADVK
ncbi:MAG: translation initiation factor [Clostridiales bacterium]|jgi:translation initiation factor IF-3|uniref:Translation initiation factor IF-3 n=1 Tax=Mahella australiensis (strain DSM 15567 / CIP 107919 / 50-1 BON) TaxID=697281 RepID=F3ZZZ5_MAHA5|nr:bacterial translation initiation factor 3 (bIF-3) [Mahella australiensis 50-1 BON]MDK2992883.1 translation initiation factor [Clostridiales bacterium]